MTADAELLKRLKAAADAAACGDFSIRIPEGGSGPAGDAARSFNAMLDRLATRLDDLESRGVAFQQALNRLGEALGSTHDRGAILDAVLDATALIVRPETAVFFVVGGRRLTARATAGDTAGEVAVDFGEGVAGWAAQMGQATIWPGSIEPSPAEPASGADTALAVPMRSGGRPFGVLALYGRRDGPAYGPDDVAALETLLRQVETAIENTFLYEEAARLSITDGLTGLWNRRQFELRAVGELQRAIRFAEPFGVMMVDLDRFKLINDTFGHQAGDAVLVETSRRLTEATREVDVIARYGGEEFVLLLPNTAFDGTCTLAEKLRDAVASEPLAIDDDLLRISVSVGVAAYPEHGTTVRELVRAADAALYRAKANGRNRVEIAGRDTLVSETEGRTV